MAISDTDKLLINDGSQTETVTIAQLKDGTVLNDTDNFLINDGVKTETVTWLEIQDELGPEGAVVTPSVLQPEDGAGSGSIRYPKTNTIIDVGPGGSITFETDTIATVTGSAPSIILTFPNTNGFDDFEAGEVVQRDFIPAVKLEEPANSVSNGVGDLDGNPNTGCWQRNVGRIVYSAGGYVASQVQVKASLAEQYGASSGTFNVVINEGLPFEETFSIVSTNSQNFSAYNTGTLNFSSPTAVQTIAVYPSDAPGDATYNMVSVAIMYLDGIALSSSGTEYKVISKDESANTITVDGGNWLGADGSGTAGGETKVSITASYTDKVTVNGLIDLVDMKGSVFATDGSGSPGPYSQTPFELTTVYIQNVDDTDPSNKILTFSGDTAGNPDLRYFKPGDAVQNQGTADEVTVVSVDVDNNKMTMDGGAWHGADGSGNPDAADVDNTTNWPAYLIARDQGPVANLWDGDLNTWSEGGAGSECNFSFDFGAPVLVTSFEFYSDSVGASIVVTDRRLAAPRYTYATVTTAGWQSIDPSVWGSAITAGDTFSLSYVGTSNVPRVSAFRINGKIALDTDVEPGAINVTYPTLGGLGDVIAVDTSDNSVLINNTGTNDNRWIAGNHEFTNFAIAGPVVVDSPLLTNNVELESTPFETLPVGVDGLKEIVWNINGVDQSAGTNNPYRPTGLPLSSLVTVKVKHIANSIGESAWSSSATFTTGSSYSLVEHYTTQITALQVALAEATGDP